MVKWAVIFIVSYRCAVILTHDINITVRPTVEMLYSCCISLSQQAHAACARVLQTLCVISPYPFSPCQQISSLLKRTSTSPWLLRTPTAVWSWSGITSRWISENLTISQVWGRGVFFLFFWWFCCPGPTKNTTIQQLLWPVFLFILWKPNMSYFLINWTQFKSYLTDCGWGY